jgi:PPOX class probable F420-dependent enzyme
MRLDEAEARRRFASARVARLATVDEHGQPHLVPITFAMRDNVIVTAVDHKPKRSANLKRLRNIAQNPRVSLLVDHYADDWTQLWWARADGTAHLTDHAPDAIALLCAKYPQYTHTPPTGPIIHTIVTAWSGWQFQTD